jgi:hypothetical protein
MPKQDVTLARAVLKPLQPQPGGFVLKIIFECSRMLPSTECKNVTVPEIVLGDSTMRLNVIEKRT